MAEQEVQVNPNILLVYEYHYSSNCEPPTHEELTICFTQSAHKHLQTCHKVVYVLHCTLYY